MSRLAAHTKLFKRLMKVKFDPYVLRPLTKKFKNLIVVRSTARDFTVCFLQYVSMPISMCKKYLIRAYLNTICMTLGPASYFQVVLLYNPTKDYHT